LVGLFKSLVLIAEIFTMKTIQTEITINATPAKVWSVLTDFESYPDWNPFIKSIKGDQSLGGKLETSILPPNRKLMKFKPRILAFDEHSELRWLGTAGIKGLFDGEHYFKIKDLKNGSVKFEHGEKFTGILVGLMPRVLVDTKTGFELMNEAFKKECEKS
jgi:hypothetical protein